MVYIFTGEMLIQIVGYSPKYYLKNNSFILDGVITILTIVDHGKSFINSNKLFKL